MAVTLADTYILTAFSEALGAPNQWRNSIEIDAGPGGPIPQPTDTIVTKFRDWVAGTQRNDSQVVKLELRKWTRGRFPFFSNPALWVASANHVGFAYHPSGAFASVSTGDGNPTVGEICVRVSKVNFGTALRAPSLFLRNVLRATDVLATPGGPPEWDQSSGHPTAVMLDAFTTTVLGPYFSPASSPPQLTNVIYSAVHGIGPLQNLMANIVYASTTMHNLSRKSPL